MGTFESLMHGFSVVFTATNLAYCLLGVVIGTIIGLLPGLGPVAVIALLLPVTFNLEPATGIIMLAGIYYGAMYGGRIPSILIGIPGDGPAIIATLDGYPLAKEGRAGSALGISAIGSFIGGSVSLIGLAFLAVPLARFAGSIGAPEIFLLAAAGLSLIVFIGSGSKLKSALMAALGLLLATIGIDPIEGTVRLTGGSVGLMGGLNIVAIAVGLFGLGDVLFRAEKPAENIDGSLKITNIFPSMQDWIMTRAAIARSSIVAFFAGVMPGGGGTLGAVVSYATQRKFSKQPEKFGKGAIDGLAAAETGDNGSAVSSFIPLLTLGLPPNPALALIFGALLLQNVTPGPQLVDEHPDVFWGVIASLIIGNVILLILNLPMIRVFVQLLRIRGSILAPIIVVVSLAGVYSVQHSMFDVGVAVAFGVLGYLLKKFEYDLGPLILAFILGPILEAEFRRTMLLSHGSFDIFFLRPVSAVLVGLIFVAVVAPQVRRLLTRRRRDEETRNIKDLESERT